jgi:hypothetical protein
LGGLSFSSSLKTINIPASVTLIHEQAFFYSFSLEAINVDPDNENYSSHEGVLYDKNKETLLYYPASKKETNYEVPSTVRDLLRLSFLNQAYLEVLILPEGITEIADNVFNEASALRFVYLPDSLVKIGFRAFADCVNLEKIFIPKSVMDMGYLVFYNCPKLTVYMELSEVPYTFDTHWGAISIVFNAERGDLDE